MPSTTIKDQLSTSSSSSSNQLKSNEDSTNKTVEAVVLVPESTPAPEDTTTSVLIEKSEKPSVATIKG